jgi:hypothetical protein
VKYRLKLDLKSDNLVSIRGQLEMLIKLISTRCQDEDHPTSRGFCKNDVVEMTYSLETKE